MLKLSENWKIDGKPIYSPSKETQIDYESLSADGAGRTDDGIMHPNFIRTRITKVYIRYSAMTQTELAYMLKLVQGREYSLTYDDPIDGIRAIKCYTGNSTMKLYSGVLYNGLWRDVTFNCIEK